MYSDFIINQLQQQKFSFSNIFKPIISNTSANFFMCYKIYTLNLNFFLHIGKYECKQNLEKKNIK